MLDAIVDWGGVKPSITYGPKDNRVKVSIGSLGGWLRKEIASSLEDEGDDKKDDENDEALVGVVHSGGHGKIIDSRLDYLGPSLNHYGCQPQTPTLMRRNPSGSLQLTYWNEHLSLTQFVLCFIRGGLCTLVS